MRQTAVKVEAGDGSRCTMTLFRGDAPAGAPVIICLPAMGVRARFYEPLAHELVRRGLNAVTADLRGHGLSKVRAGRHCSYGYHEMVTLDWPAIVNGIRGALPDCPLYLLGHSLGGQVSALYAAAFPGQVQGLILAASGTVYHRGWRFPQSLGILVFTQLATLVAGAVGFFPGKQLGFAGREGRALIRDWARNARTGRFDFDGSDTDFEGLLGAVKLPVLSFQFAGDGLAPEGSVDHLCRKMPDARHTRVRLDTADNGEKLGHFNWVQYPVSVARELVRWLQAGHDERCRTESLDHPGGDVQYPPAGKDD